MIITLEELNKCVSRLPDPEIAVQQGLAYYRLPIAEPLPIKVLTEELPTNGPNIRIATFRLKEYRKADKCMWRWAPTDEVII